MMNQEGTGVPGGGPGGGNITEWRYFYQNGAYYIGTENDGAYGPETIVPDISQYHLNSYPIPHASQYAAAPMGSNQSNPMSYELII